MPDVWAVYYQSPDGSIDLLSIWTDEQSAEQERDRLDRAYQTWGGMDSHDIRRYELNKAAAIAW